MWRRLGAKGRSNRFGTEEERPAQSKGSVKGLGRNESSFSRLTDVQSCSLKYAVAIEWGATSHEAHVPDLTGHVAVGEIKMEVGALIRQAIEL